MENKLSRNESFDMLKAIGAVLVILIHSQFCGRTEMNVFVRIAVPLFFVLSGYCMYSSDQEKFESRIKKSLKKMLRVLLWTTPLYFLLLLPIYLRDGFPPMKAYVDFLLFNEHPYGFHLWYIASYVYVLLLAYLFSKWNIRELAFKYAPLLLLINFCLGEFSTLTVGHQVVSNFYLRNYLLMGLPFFSIGYWMAHRRVGDYVSSVGVNVGIVLITLLTFCEQPLLSRILNVSVDSNVDVYITSSLLSVLLVLWASRYSISSRLGSWLAKLGEKYSLDVYLYHAAVLIVVRMLVKFVPSVVPLYELVLEPYAVLIFTLLFVVVLRMVMTRFSIFKRGE